MAPHKSSGASKRATSHQYSWLLPLGETYWWARATRDPDTWHWVQQHITYWMALQIYRCAHVCVLHPSGQQLNTHWWDPHCGSWDRFWLATCIRSVEGLWGAPNKVDGGYIFVFEHSGLTTRCLFLWSPPSLTSELWHQRFSACSCCEQGILSFWDRSLQTWGMVEMWWESESILEGLLTVSYRHRRARWRSGRATAAPTPPLLSSLSE